MDIDSLQDFRDVTLIAFTIAGTILFLVATVFTLAVGFLSLGTVWRVRSTVKNSVQPAAESLRETSDNLRSTVAFISDHAIMPVVRVYSAYAGARRFVAVIMRFARPRAS